MKIIFTVAFAIQKDELSKAQHFQNHVLGHLKQIQIIFNHNHNNNIRIIINCFVKNKEGLDHSILEDFIKKLIKFQDNKLFSQKNKIKMQFNLICKVRLIMCFGIYYFS